MELTIPTDPRWVLGLLACCFLVMCWGRIMIWNIGPDDDLGKFDRMCGNVSGFSILIGIVGVGATIIVYIICCIGSNDWTPWW